ncbi:MAG: hypothetical protein JNM17_25530, partial [Archangium sp.]|nr:hypothetical protein [Archangium sp.]
MPNAKVQELFDWLVDGAPGAPTPMAVLERLGPDLNAAGVPVHRMSAFVKTLHPSIVGRRFIWEIETGKTQVGEAPWELINAEVFKRSPFARVFETGQVDRCVLHTLTLENTPSDVLELKQSGFTDIVFMPMRFMGGTVHAISFATRANGGFTDAQLETITFVVRPLSRV